MVGDAFVIEGVGIDADELTPGEVAEVRVAWRTLAATEKDYSVFVHLVDEEELIARLDRIDGRSKEGPWTRRVLELIEAHPAVRAGNLCKTVGQERLVFKQNVRKLKTLGLTESLEVGYRLSPRGVALLEKLRSGDRDDRRKK